MMSAFLERTAKVWEAGTTHRDDSRIVDRSGRLPTTATEQSLTTPRRLGIVPRTIAGTSERPAFRSIIRLPSFESSARDLLDADVEAWLDYTIPRAERTT